MGARYYKFLHFHQNYNFNYITMDVSSGKSISKYIGRPKSMNKITKPKKITYFLAQPPLLSSSQRNPIKAVVSCEQSITTSCCNNLNIKFKIKLNEFLKWKICANITILLCLMSLVEAYSANDTPIAEYTAEYTADDLVVCLPLNSSSCTTFVNSPRNGLIEINETLYPALKAFGGSYDYKMIARISPFWLTFEPPNNESYFIMGTLYMLIFVFGVTGNGLVIYMFARCKALRTASYILVFHLSLSDIMIVIKCPMAAYNNFMRGPALGDWGCRLYGFIGGFSGTASIGMLTVISLDRYSVVVNPLSPLRFNYKSKYYYVLLSMVWLDALIFSMLPLCEVGLSSYVPEGYLTTCSFDYLDKSTHARIFMFAFFVFAFLIPLIIICYCYFHILKAVFTAKTIQSNRNKQQIEIRLALVVLLVIGLWFLAWTPYALVAMAGVFGKEEYLTPTKSMIPALFCKTASCLNPFLYTISHKRFRNEFQRLFCKRPPIYQYSMTRSSYMTRSTKRSRNRVDLCNDGGGGGGVGVRGGNVEQSVYKMELDTCRRNLRSKISIDACSGGHKRQTIHQEYKNRETNKKHRISIMSSEENSSIFVIDVDSPNLAKSPSFSSPQPLETNF